MKLVHFYGGPLDGEPESPVAIEARHIVVPQFKLSYIYSEAWSCYFKRPTFVCSTHKGLPPSGKGVAA